MKWKQSKVMEKDQKELLKKAVQGDAAAFGKIVERYQGLVYATSFQVVKDPATASDATQDTFIRAFTRLAELRTLEAFPGWLRTISRNAAIAARRSRGKFAPIEDAGTLPVTPPPSTIEVEADQAEQESFRAQARQLVSSLSDAQRFPILLCYIDGISTADAARYLGIREGTLRKRLHDGKRKLQERIVQMAERTLQEYRLPPGFARRCICGCRRARPATMQRETKERR